MKTRISNVCITALILSASAIGQKAPDTKDILSLGNTELTLGLTRDVVISRLTEQNTITKFDNDENALLVRSKNPPYISGEVIFKSGKLVFAERDWSSDSDSVSFLSALRGVLIQFGNEGRHMCLVTTGGSQAAGGQSQNIAVICGAKRLVMSVNEIFTGPHKGKSTSLQEQIGSLGQ